MDSLKATIMRRDKLTSEEADEQINTAKQAVLDGANPEELLEEEFGLEPDYIFDLI